MILHILLQALWYALLLVMGLFTVGCLWAVYIMYSFDRWYKKSLRDE